MQNQMHYIRTYDVQKSIKNTQLVPTCRTRVRKTALVASCDRTVDGSEAPLINSLRSREALHDEFAKFGGAASPWEIASDASLTGSDTAVCCNSVVSGAGLPPSGGSLDWPIARTGTLAIAPKPQCSFPIYQQEQKNEMLSNASKLNDAGV